MKRTTQKSHRLTLPEIEQRLFPKRAQHGVLSPGQTTVERGTGLACDFGTIGARNRRARARTKQSA